MDESEAEAITLESKSVRFGLIAIFYWTALIAIAVGWIGASGLLLCLGCMVLHAYAVAYGEERIYTKFAKAILWVGAFAGPLSWLLISSMGDATEAARRSISLSNMKQIGLAIEKYEIATGKLPSPVTYSPDGKPLHSWRVALLPYIGEQTLFSRIDASVPWDSPQNVAIFEDGVPRAPVSFYRSHRPAVENAPDWETHYFAVVGPETAWPDGELVSMADITDGPENTVLLIEAAGRDVGWCEPIDLTVNEAVDLLAGQSSQTWIDQGYFTSTRRRGDGMRPRVVVFADGSTTSYYPNLTREHAKALLTRSGGEEVDRYAIRGGIEARSDDFIEVIINWKNVIPTVLFATLVFAPCFQKPRRFIYC